MRSEPPGFVIRKDVLVRGRGHSVAAGEAPGGVGRVGDDGVDGGVGELGHEAEGLALEEGPAGFGVDLGHRAGLSMLRASARRCAVSRIHARARVRRGKRSRAGHEGSGKAQGRKTGSSSAARKA